MALTEKGQHVLDLIKQFYITGEFSTKDLSEVAGEKVYPASITALVKNGYLKIVSDTSPKTYRLLGEGEDISITTKATEDKDVTNAAVVKLFGVQSKIKTTIESALHWMNHPSYATEPGSQKGIYRIVDNRNNRVIYIGQTGGKGNGGATFNSRWEQHKAELVANNHHCAELQKYFNNELNSDLNNLRFEIQEELPSDKDLIEYRERYWIEFYGASILNTLRPELLKVNSIMLPETAESAAAKDLIGLQVITREVAAAIHDYLYAAIKLSDQDKASLIAGIVIALNYTSFKNSYRSAYDDGTFFVKNFINALDCSVHSYKGLKSGKDQIVAVFNFIEHDENFAKTISYNGKTYIALQLLTEIIDDSVCKIAAAYPKYDVMGDFYNEFSKYSGADQQSLGIVLTPHHIADFMADLLEIKEDDVIMDTCCGTSSLLLTADHKTEPNNKLLGVEFNARMMALSLANMIMRGADATLWLGDCFDKDILQQIHSYQPTKLIINPPYSQDQPELQFFINALDQLQPHGLGAVILPVGAVCKKDILPLKEQLLNKHKLIGIFNMPEKLFYPVSTYTVVLLFEAYSNNDKDTFICSIKDDGFETVKNKGRLDIYNKWFNIKQNILNNYYNHTNDDQNVWNNINALQDWSCDAFIKYTKPLTKQLFIRTIRNYILFNKGAFNKGDVQAYIDYIFDVLENQPNLSQSKNNNVYELKDMNFQDFTFQDIFNLKRGQGGKASEAKKNIGENKYIGASNENNGITQYTSLLPTEACNTITVANNGSVGATFFQSQDYLASSDVTVLSLKNNQPINASLAMFLCTMIRRAGDNFDYGRKWGISRMQESYISLPVDEQGEPDWQLMEDYINSLPYSATL